MSQHCLGSHFDIHGGGMDLKFPHHENEIAQSEAASGHKFVNYWMHNGFVQINEEKMSKSLGNFFTVREVLRRYQPEVVRFFILSSHYRSPLNYSEENLEHARSSLTRLYTALRGLEKGDGPIDASFERRFKAAMDDDFNTSEALSVLFELAHQTNRIRSEDLTEAIRLGASLRRLGHVLGLVEADPENFLKGGEGEPGPGLSTEEIEALIAQRNAARKQKNWAEADGIRDLLAAQGVVLEDGPGGTTWRRQ